MDEIEKTGTVPEEEENTMDEYLHGNEDAEELPNVNEAEVGIETEENKKIQWGRDNGSMTASFLGGIIGAFVALILISVCCAVVGKVGYFPYILIPLCICFATVILKGNKGICGYVVSVVFTAVGMFLAPAFGAAVEFAGKQGISALSVPMIAFSKMGEANFFTGITFSSAYVFPAVFALIGLAAVWQIFRYYRIKQN